MKLVTKFVTIDEDTGEIIKEKFIRNKSSKGQFYQLYYTKNSKRLNVLGNTTRVYLTIVSLCLSNGNGWTKIDINDLMVRCEILVKSTVYKIIDKLRDAHLITVDGSFYQIDRNVIDR